MAWTLEGVGTQLHETQVDWKRQRCGTCTKLRSIGDETVCLTCWASEPGDVSLDIEVVDVSPWDQACEEWDGDPNEDFRRKGDY